MLPPGNRSLTITPTLAPSSGGSGYLRATNAVPEPSTWMLLGAGLALLSFRRRRTLIALACLAILTVVWFAQRPAAAQGYVAAARFAGPASSQPLAITADDAFMVVANPDNNSMSFFDLRQDRIAGCRITSDRRSNASKAVGSAQGATACWLASTGRRERSGVRPRWRNMRPGSDSRRSSDCISENAA